MKILLLTMLGLFAFGTLKSQDFHFSGNEQLPMYLNPAMTGFLKESQGRVMVKYRNQWGAILENNAFETSAASIEYRICNRNFWGIGGFFMRDQSGQPSFQTTQGLFSISYHHNLGRQTFLAGGINTGFINYQVDDRLTFAEQYDGDIGFNFNLPSFETIDQFEANLIDIGMGLLWYGGYDKYKWFAGFSLQHINNSTSYQFKQNNRQDGVNLRMRKTIHGGIAIKFNKSYEIAFKGNLQWQEPHWQSVFGIYFQVVNLNLGVATRLARNQPNALTPPIVDAAIISFNYKFTNLTFGFSYDVNVSPLYRSTNYKGAMEFTASYQFGESSKCVECPRF